MEWVFTISSDGSLPQIFCQILRRFSPFWCIPGKQNIFKKHNLRSYVFVCHFTKFVCILFNYIQKS